MGKNRNNSSNRISKKDATKGIDPRKIAKTAGKTVSDTRMTRSSAKRDVLETSCDEQPLSKRIKTNPKATKVSQLKRSDNGKLSKETKETDRIDSVPVPVVASAKSLISSIKNGTLNRVEKANMASKKSSNATSGGPVRNSPKPTTSSKRQIEYRDQNDSENSVCDDDGVDLDLSDDDYDRRSYSSHSEGEYTSGDDSSDQSVDEDESEIDSPRDGSPERGPDDNISQQLPSDEELDRNDPRVRRLVDKLMEEERETSMRKGNDRDLTKKVSKRVSTKFRKEFSKVKSPSDTTLYAPALCKEVNSTPTGIGIKHIRPNNSLNISDHISDFVEKLRTSSRSDSTRDGKDRHHGRDRRHSKDRHRDTSRDRERSHKSRSRSVADDIVLQAERFKATIEPPKGTDSNETLNENVRELLAILKNTQSLEQDNDDDFFHVTCHIESSVRSKIEKGDFVDLEKLLPKNKLQIMSGNDGDIEVIRKNGSTYILPESGQKDLKITNVRKWEQAFRVYSAIYSEANPSRAAEIWQYVHVINTAAQSYAWENVSFYDVTFRQLMEKKPHRSWAKIYTQMWNLALTDRVSKTNYSGYQGSAGFNSRDNNNKKYGDWRDKCCWRFNKGKCKKWNCHWDHRCSVKECGSYSHPSYQCAKKKQGGMAAPSTSGVNRSGGVQQKQSETKL